MSKQATRDHSEGITATTEANEIADSVELVRLHGIPDGWGSTEGDSLSVTVGDGRVATFIAIGPPHSSIFSWSYDSYFTHVARLEKIAGTVLRVTILDKVPAV